MRVTTQNRELVLSGEGGDPDIMIWNRLPLALQFIAKQCVEDRGCGVDAKCLNIELKSCKASFVFRPMARPQESKPVLPKRDDVQPDVVACRRTPSILGSPSMRAESALVSRIISRHPHRLSRILAR
jgi:hypothetical protein